MLHLGHMSDQDGCHAYVYMVKTLKKSSPDIKASFYTGPLFFLILALKQHL